MGRMSSIWPDKTHIFQLLCMQPMNYSYLMLVDIIERTYMGYFFEKILVLQVLCVHCHLVRITAHTELYMGTVMGVVCMLFRVYYYPYRSVYGYCYGCCVHAV